MASPDVLISGIGQSAIGRKLNRTGLSLTIDSVLQAIADAGLKKSDIDGVVTFPGRLMGSMYSFSPIGCHELIQALGLEVKYYTGVFEGGGQLVAFNNAYNAIKTGQCRHVIVFRTIAEGSGGTFWNDNNPESGRVRVDDMFQYFYSMDAHTMINWMAQYVQRHFHLYGTKREQMGWIAVNARRNAGRNPKAIFQKPMTIDDYMNAKMLSTPMCLLDCDPLTDASTAFILSSSETKRDLRTTPVKIEAISGSLNKVGAWDQGDLPRMSATESAKAMWAQTDLKLKDVDVGLIYDGYTFLTMTWLEALGFCGVGESGPFIEGGERIGMDADIPINPHGGQLSEGRTHGFGHVHEAVMQLRRIAGERQVKGDPEVAVTCNGAGIVCGSMLLTRQ
jgi:acetyl-CoA acetyltransferase